MVDIEHNHPRSTIGILARKATDMARNVLLQEKLTEAGLEELQKRLRIVDKDSGPIQEEEYEKIFRNDCEFVGTEKALSKKFIGALLNKLAEHRKDFKTKIAEDESTLALGVFPTTSMGTNLSDEAIEAGNHISPMVVKENGKTVTGISMVKGPYFYVLPKVQQEKCSIQIKYTDNDADDFARIHNFCIDAFNSWREFFGLEPIEDIPRLELSN